MLFRSLDILIRTENILSDKTNILTNLGISRLCKADLNHLDELEPTDDYLSWFRLSNYAINHGIWSWHLTCARYYVSDAAKYFYVALFAHR